MNDRSNSQPQAGYPAYSQYPAPKQYPTAHSSSSAFSASANPNEDWTKISDLAERRRIQNRIAQRNYRKKLKKRLEDLERRAGSGSASPEQSQEDLPLSLPPQQQKQQSLSPPQQHTTSRAVASIPASSRQRPELNQIRRDRTPEVLTQQYALPSEERGMFSQQYTRQLSTSPPPFPYAAMPVSEDASYGSYSCTPSFCHSAPSSMNVPLYHHYLPPMPSHNYGMAGLPSNPVKQEFFADDDISPFSMSYANLAGADASATQSFHEVAAYP